MNNAPRFRLYMAISLDGFIASPDGGVKWLEPYDPYSVGFGEFLTGIGSVVMGRKSFEQMLSFGPWPYEGKRTVVMTRGNFPVTTPQTEITSEPVNVIADRLARETTNGDVWIFGGGEIARAFLKGDATRWSSALFRLSSVTGFRCSAPAHSRANCG